MHGVKKEKYTEAVQKARKLAEEQKVAEYLTHSQKSNQLRNEKVMTDEALEATEKLLSMNAEYYSMWNYRREIFLDRIANRPSEELQKMFEYELKFIVTAIQGHPKSYWVWHHRVWVLDHMPSPNWEYELHLCNKMLDLDTRNFHCWDFRRLVLKKISKHGPSEELAYTYKKICQNFSNYSAFHLRSKLLPIVYPPSDQAAFQKSLEQEFELVKNAVFTEPADQSPWLYHRWLLGKSQHNLFLLGAYKLHLGDVPSLIVVFSEPVKFKENGLEILYQGQKQSGRWVAAHHIENHYSHVWIFNFNSPVSAETHQGQGEQGFILQGQAADLVSRFLGSYMKTDLRVFFEDIKPQEVTGVVNPITPYNEEILKKELKSINELLEIEPDSKSPLLICALIQHALGMYEEAEEKLGKLVTIDSYRKNYYLDYKSQVLLEQFTNRFLKQEAGTVKLQCSTSELDLQGKQITSLYLTERLCLVKKLKLANNHIKKMTGIYMLLSVEELNLDNNNIKQLQGLKHLKNLKRLSLRNNQIQDLEDVADLLASEIKTLEKLDLTGNPISKNDQFKSVIITRFPNTIF